TRRKGLKPAYPNVKSPLRTVNPRMAMVPAGKARNVRLVEMAEATRHATVLPLAQERRRHQRVKVALTGRFMREDRHEYACQTINMSPGGVWLQADATPQVGERVVAYIDH